MTQFRQQKTELADGTTILGVGSSSDKFRVRNPLPDGGTNGQVLTTTGWNDPSTLSKKLIPVTGNITLSDIHHNSILLIKANCTINIVASSIRADFVADARVYNGVTCNVTGSVNFVESDGSSLTGKGMFTLFKDGASIILCGDF
jgi:hypothetical protein